MPLEPHYTYQQFRRVHFREAAPGSPDFSFAVDQSRCTRTYYIPWEEQREALEDFLGFTTVEEFSPGLKYFHRHIPHEHPNYPGFFFASRIPKMDGLIAVGQDNNRVGQFDEAKMMVEYEAHMFEIIDDAMLALQATYLGYTFADEASLLRYVEPDLQHSAKFQTLPAFSALKFNSSNYSLTPNGPPVESAPGVPRATGVKPMAMAVPFLLFEGDITIKWYYIPVNGYPKTAISNTVGRTNNAPFGNASWIFGTFPAGTLVCAVPATKMIRMPNGRFAVNVTYRFKYYPFGANSFYWHNAPGFYHNIGHPAHGTRFFPASHDGAGAQPLFPLADYNELFRPEP